MGYPVPNLAVKFTTPLGTYAIGCFDWDTPFGQAYKAAVFQLTASGEWDQVGVTAADYANPGDLLADMQKKGSKVNYAIWLKARFNLVLQGIFNVAPPPVLTGEPQTDREARDWLNAQALKFTVTVVNGIPTVS